MGREPVFCRIGSLENRAQVEKLVFQVFCRIGSLEKLEWRHADNARVFCRIGSLEKFIARADFGQ